jgi:hypothetical protein
LSIGSRAWKTSISQGAAVLGGVLLALGADASWDYRTDRIEEGEYLHALQGDFEENRDRIEELLSHHEAADRDFKRLFTVIDSAGQADISGDSVWVLMGSMYSLPPYDPILSTLDDLIQSGGLNLIRDDSLRVGLAEFRRALEVHELSERYAEDYWSSEMVALFREDMAVRNLFDSELGPSKFSTDLVELLGTRRFENRVATRWSLGGDLLQSAAQVSNTVDVILGRLEVLLPAK